MKKLLFFAVIISSIFVSCKKESVDTVSSDELSLRKKHKADTCTHVTPIVQLGKDPSSGIISGAIIITYNNPCTTYKALDVKVDRITKCGKRVAYVYNTMLARPGINELDADGYYLPDDTKGLEIEVKSYPTNVVQGKACDVASGSCKLK